MHGVWAQCNALRPQRDITFNTDQDCAPVTVTDFTITYFFNTPQDPANINIIFEWNDPGNNISVTGLGTGMTASGGNMEFTASGSFTYVDNQNQCTIIPTAYIYIGGVLCPSSAQVQPAFFWGTDEQANADLFINPQNYDVCYEEPVVNAIFRDNSDFNCRIAIEPDNPNRAARHVQFVYGTNHDASTTILDLSLEDGGTQPLTTGTGTLANPQTRGTLGLQVTAGYFGPVETVPFPADNPTSITFPMNAPANAANLVGHDFEITMYNWNVCNPFNGDQLNPNYDDAIATTAYIRIVDGPAPAFVTRRDDASGPITTTFCIGEQIYFENTTAGAGFGYVWQLYDDELGTTEVFNSTNTNPTYSYLSAGQKLLRLTASNPTAQGSCDDVYESLVTISPSLIAAIGLTDYAGNTIGNQFCQNMAGSEVFQIRFNDVSAGSITANTRWRWEFYDEVGNLALEMPASGGFSDAAPGPMDVSVTNPGVYRAVLRIADNATTCETIDEALVYIYPSPQAALITANTCEGNAITVTDNSALTPVNGESIIQWEWDLDYDGVTFQHDPLYDGMQTFDYTYASSGTYTIAVRVITDTYGCSAIGTTDVTVYPLPVAQISADINEGCSILPVTFSTLSVGSQPDVIDQYIWEADYGSGWLVDSVQNPADPSFSANLIRYFENNTNSDLTVDVRLRAITQQGCEQFSDIETIRVLPAPKAGFNSINYSPFNDNCSPVDVTFRVDGDTQAQSPTDYLWTVRDEIGALLNEQSTGITPQFNYTFVNTSTSIQDYTVTLTSSLGGACVGDSTLTIRVNPIPVAGFEIDTVDLTCSQFTLRAVASAVGMASYDWQVRANDVIVYSETEPTGVLEYTINKAGTPITLEVQLITENFAGCQSEPSAEELTVEEEREALASFTATPGQQSYPETTVTLNNLAYDPAITYLWDFGNGETSDTGNLTAYSYQEAGTYSIRLTASSGGCSDTQVKTITINPARPVIDFDYDPPAGCAPLVVNFTNLSQYAVSDTYLWDFGDGSTSTQVNPVHTYFEPGIYTVSLTAANSVGESATEIKSQIIEVYETPFAQFNVRPNVVSIPDNPIYTNNGSIGATSYLWDFGDGSTSTEYEPEHYYQEEGTYSITLIASNLDGCADTLTRDNIVKAEEMGRLLIPNAFTPSTLGPSGGYIDAQAGTNDIFLPIMTGVREFELLIFNRWGELLFRSGDQRVGWDGYYNGRLCQQDVYVYKLNLVFDNGRATTRVGDVNLIR